MALSFLNHSTSTLILTFVLYLSCWVESGNGQQPDFIQQLEEENPDQFRSFYTQSLEWCRKSTLQLLEISELEKLLNDVYYIDDPNGIVINGDITFNSVSVLSELASPDIISSRGVIYSDQLQDSLTTIKEDLIKAEKGLVALNTILSNAIQLNGHQTVTGDITFDTVYLNCGPNGCDIDSIETTFLNGRNVDKLSSKVIRLNQDQDLVDHFNFSSLIVQDLEANFINNILPADIVTKDHDIFINGIVAFEGPVAVNHLVVPGTVNGLSFNRQTVLTTTESQVITTPISFTEGINVRDLHIEGRLPESEKDVNTFLSDVVQIDSNRPISGRKIFNTLYVENLMLNGDSINGFNLTDLSRNLLTRDGPQTILGHVNVDNLIIKGDAWVDNINDQRFDEVFVRRGSPIVVKGDKFFTGPVSIRSMEVNGSLNGRPILNRSLGILLKSGNQVVSGSKIFRNITANEISVYGGQIGPLGVTELENRINRMVKGGRDRILSGPIKLESIQVDGLINGINLTSLQYDYLKVNQSVVPGISLEISKAIFKKSLKCEYLNGMKFPDDFITTTTDQTISWPVFFRNNVTVTSNLNISTINGYSFNASLFDSLVTNGDQYISGHKKLAGNLHVKNLYIEQINGIPMKDIVLVNGGDKNILGNKIFNSVVVNGSSNISSITGLKSINIISFSELIHNSIDRRSYQSITPNIHVKKLIIPQNGNINVTWLEGMRLDDILSSAVYLYSNKTQAIRGRKRFAARTTFGNIEFYKTFAGYTRDQFRKTYLARDDSEIHANVTINSDLIVNDLTVTGTINNLNIDRLRRSLPVHYKPIIINHPMKFRHVRVVGGDIESPIINGLNFNEEMITRKSSINISGDAYFPNGISAKTLTVTSTINNVSISGSMCDPLEHIFTKPYSLTIIGNVTSEGAIKSGTVNGKIFNEKIVEQMKRDLWSGPKRFRKLVVDGPINLGGRLNNHDLSYLSRNYLSLTKSQIIDSEVILKNVTFSGSVYIGGNLVGENAMINNVDLTRFANTTLRNVDDQSIFGQFTFPRNVIFKKGLIHSPMISLNDKVVNLSRDIFLKDRPNQINSSLFFYNGFAVKDVSSSEQSNFKRQLRTLELLTTPSLILGHKNFKSLEVDDLEVEKINGISVASFLRTDESANITGTFFFEDGLEIKNNLSVLGTVNGIKLNDLKSRLTKEMNNPKKNFTNH